ncbi:MAG: hypothetical protein J0H84_20120 [Rhizobiales bacterium]|nr:hypothetical protein [Hyphomicrobiales bacterium]
MTAAMADPFAALPGVFVRMFSRGAVIAVTPVAGFPRQVTGIYRAAGMVITGPDIDAMGDTPLLHLAEADSYDLDEGASVSILPAGACEELFFTIATREPDGRGMVVFRLQETD